MKHNLVIFDIDGTLTQTTCMDAEAYLQAFTEYLQISEINQNWHEYRYSTDSGFAIEIFEKHLNRLAQDEEIKVIKQKFFSLLEEKITTDPNCCLPLPGAKMIVQKIRFSEHWDSAIATGGWLNSALMKLKYAEVDYTRIPMASGDDHVERHEIVRTAFNRAKIHYQRDHYDTVVYIGDRLWDYHASQKLGIKFIGVGNEFLKSDLLVPKINDYTSNKFINYLNLLQNSCEII